MTFYKSLIYIFLLNGIIVYFSKKRFEAVIPFSFILVFLTLFAFSFVKHVSYGYYFLWLCIIVFYLYLLSAKTKRKIFLKNYLTGGTLVYLILFTYVYFLQEGRGFNWWDEFGHWGPMVKETFRLDKLYCVQSSGLQRHRDYPPFFTLIELLWCYFGGTYKESYLYIALMSFTTSLFMPIFSFISKEKKSIIKTLFIMVSLVFMWITIGQTSTASDSARMLNSVYIDWPMSVFVAFTMYEIIESDNSVISRILISTLFVSLLMMKQMGLPFYLLGVLLIAARDLFSKTNGNPISLITNSVLYLVIPLIFYFGWSFFIKYIGVSSWAQFKISDIGLDFISITEGIAGEAWQIESAGNYLDAILNRVLVLRPFKMSYFPYVALVCVVLFAVIDGRKKKLAGTLVFAFGSLGYAFAMFLLYIYSFGPYEGPELASFDRYLISYLYIGNCLVFLFFVKRFHCSNLVYLLPFIVFLFAESADLKQLLPYEDRECLFGENPMAEALNYPDIKKEDKVLVIDQTRNDTYYYAMFGYLNEYCDLTTIVSYETENIETVNLTSSEWVALLRNYNYLYILTTNEFLEDNYLAGMEVSDYSLYKIVKTEFKTELCRIN